MLSLRTLPHQTGSLAAVALRLAAHAASHGPTRLVIPVNGQVFVLARQKPEFAATILQAEDVVLDGISVHSGVRLLKDRTAERVPGVDLMMQVCREADTHSLRVMLVGGRPGAGEHMKALLAAACPNLTVEVNCPPMGFDSSEQGVAMVTDAIRAFAPDILFVAFGAPRQEMFMDRYVRPLNIPVVMAVGGSFEMLSGMVQRAPKWMQSIGLEWAFRMVKEPRRLLWRYLSTNTAFLWILMTEMVAGRRTSPQQESRIG